MAKKGDGKYTCYDIDFQTMLKTTILQPDYY